MKKKIWMIMTLAVVIGLSACAKTDEKKNDGDTATGQAVSESGHHGEQGTKSSVSATEAESGDTIKNSEDGGHAIEVDGKEQTYENVKVIKTGNSDGDEADFYGENAAVFATGGAVLTMSDMQIDTNGTHANGVFSYGEGTTVKISDSEIKTSSNCSGGLMTTGGGTMIASNLTIDTKGNSSAAIRSDRGGGTVTVEKGTYQTSGTGSPVIYSTADITVRDATMKSTASQGVVVEGQNSVQLENVDLTASNTKKNSDKSSYYQAVMIYQSMSGDAAEGTASFGMKKGTLTNQKGDIFFVNNTVATIDLNNVSIHNEDKDGIFLRAAAAGWGKEGSNGGNVTMNAKNQKIEGDIVVDEVSALNFYLSEDSSWQGAVNQDGKGGSVYVELKGGATWKLTADSYITSLTCDADSIQLNGHKLYVNGKQYKKGKSEGTAVEIKSNASSESGEKPDGKPEGESGGRPSGKPEGKSGSRPSGKPEKESGNRPSGKPEGTPPAKPDGQSNPGEKQES